MSASPGWTWQMPNMSEDGWILQKQDQIGLERFARWSDEYKCFLSNNTKGKLCKSPSDHLVWREVRFDWFQNIQGLMSPVMIFRHICLDIEVKYRFLERTDGRVQGRTWGPSGAKIQTWKKKLKYFLYILYLSKKEKKMGYHSLKVQHLRHCEMPSPRKMSRVSQIAKVSFRYHPLINLFNKFWGISKLLYLRYSLN